MIRSAHWHQYLDQFWKEITLVPNELHGFNGINDNVQVDQDIDVKCTINIWDDKGISRCKWCKVAWRVQVRVNGRSESEEHNQMQRVIVGASWHKRYMQLWEWAFTGTSGTPMTFSRQMSRKGRRRSRISCRRGRQHSRGRRQHTNFPKNCMKLRKFWSLGSTAGRCK